MYQVITLQVLCESFASLVAVHIDIIQADLDAFYGSVLKFDRSNDQ